MPLSGQVVKGRPETVAATSTRASTYRRVRQVPLNPKLLGEPIYGLRVSLGKAASKYRIDPPLPIKSKS